MEAPSLHITEKAKVLPGYSRGSAPIIQYSTIYYNTVQNTVQDNIGQFNTEQQDTSQHQIKLSSQQNTLQALSVN